MAPLEQRFAVDTVHLALALSGLSGGSEPSASAAHLALALPGQRVVGLVVLGVDLHNCIHLSSLQGAGGRWGWGPQAVGLSGTGPRYRTSQLDPSLRLAERGQDLWVGAQPAGLVRGCNPMVGCPTLARCGAGGAEAQFAGQPMGQLSPLLKPTCAWVRAAVFSACRSLWPAKGRAGG